MEGAKAAGITSREDLTYRVENGDTIITGFGDDSSITLVNVEWSDLTNRISFSPNLERSRRQWI